MKGLVTLLFILLSLVAAFSYAEKAESQGSAEIKTTTKENKANINITANGSGEAVTSSSTMKATADNKSGKSHGVAKVDVKKKKDDGKKKKKKKN